MNYSGPGRGKENDLPGDVTTIGLILPLHGIQAGDGRALQMAAQMAVEEEAVHPLPGGRRLALAIGDESGPWGQASSEIVRLIVQEHAVALITSPNGNIAHQAEQVSNKIGVPIVTLSSDPTTTEINIPWIFRMGPSDTAEARIFAHHIYQERGFRKVLLVVPSDHDGRVASEEFEKAARKLRAQPPGRLEITASGPTAESVAVQVAGQSPDAIVFFGTAAHAQELLPLIHKARPSAPIYLCQRASQFVITRASALVAALPAANPTETAWVWLAVSALPAGGLSLRHDFDRRFYARSGAMPSVAAAQTYDAVKMVIAALRVAGPNRPRLRDRLAAGLEFPGVSGILTFDGFGNSKGELILVELPGAQSFLELHPSGAPSGRVTQPQPGPAPGCVP